MPEIAQELQEKFVLYQLLNQRLEQLKQQAPLIQQKMVEYETSKQAMAELKSVKPDNDILIPMGSGVYSFGKTNSSEKVLVELGAGVVAKKTLEEASVLVENKKKELEDAVQALQMEANAITAKLNEIVPELQKAAEKSQEGQAAGAG